MAHVGSRYETIGVIAQISNLYGVRVYEYRVILYRFVINARCKYKTSAH
jgi:hypothetical protein